jgi:hypothetical protein
LFVVQTLPAQSFVAVLLVDVFRCNSSGSEVLPFVAVSSLSPSSMARPRQATSPNWPTLSLFAIYSAVPLLEPHEEGKRLNDQEEVAAQLLYVRSPAEELTYERRGRLMGTVMGVAGFTQSVFLSLVPASGG